MTTWRAIIEEESQKPYYQKLRQFIKKERAQGKVIYPKDAWVYNALKVTPFNGVKVVILGQDPYHGVGHGEGQAHGLAFSVPVGIPIPPSLQNIYKAIQHDYQDFILPSHGYLLHWAKQGILLLNTVLTVEKGQAHSHSQIGWEQLTDRLLFELNDKREQLVFLLWGSHAKKKGRALNPHKHLILTSVHPSPLSAYRGFLTCGHFYKANTYLKAHQKTSINWGLPEY